MDFWPPKRNQFPRADRHACSHGGQRRGGFGLSGGEKVPPLDFESPTAAARGRWLPEAARLERPNPLRDSLRVTARSMSLIVGHRS